MKLTITVGISEIPIPTMKAKSKAFPTFSRSLKIAKTGNGEVVTWKVKSESFVAVFSIDS